jgi:hypothetical protein
MIWRELVIVFKFTVTCNAERLAAVGAMRSARGCCDGIYFVLDGRLVTDWGESLGELLISGHESVLYIGSSKHLDRRTRSLVRAILDPSVRRTVHGFGERYRTSAHAVGIEHLMVVMIHSPFGFTLEREAFRNAQAKRLDPMGNCRPPGATPRDDRFEHRAV